MTGAEAGWLPIRVRRQLWGLWTVFLALLALLQAILLLVPKRQDPWHPAETAVAGFVLALLALTAAVSSFALREKLGEVRDAAPDPVPPASVVRIRSILLALWARCLLIALLGCPLAYGAASPAAAWPFVLAAAVLLVLHAPRHGLLGRPAP